MKLAPLFAVSPFLLLVAARQGGGFPEPLATDLSKLSSAKSVTVSYSYLVNGESQGKWQLTMSRDDLFKLTYPGGFVLSDGKQVYSYDKGKNTYTVAPLTDDERLKFERRPDVFGWAAFLDKKPGSDIESATAGASHAVKGNDVQDADVVLKDKKGTGTIFVDSKLGVARGFKLKAGDKEYMAIADSVDLSQDAASADKFAFVAPDGATKTDAAAATASFDQVSQLLNSNCMPCHDSSNQKAGLDVTSYDSIVADVTPGHGSASLLVKALRGAGGVQLMPKGRTPLSEDQIQTVQSWIDAGAKK